MSRPLLVKYLRIAFTAACGITCVLLCVLWIDSYYHIDHWLSFPFPGFKRITLQPWFGDLRADAYWDESMPGDYQGKAIELIFSAGYAFTVPYWSLVATAGTLAAVPWFRWSKRFSLRTLLIATALIAVGLGLIVWAVR